MNHWMMWMGRPAFDVVKVAPDSNEVKAPVEMQVEVVKAIAPRRNDRCYKGPYDQIPKLHLRAVPTHPIHLVLQGGQSKMMRLSVSTPKVPP